MSVILQQATGSKLPFNYMALCAYKKLESAQVKLVTLLLLIKPESALFNGR